MKVSKMKYPCDFVAIGGKFRGCWMGAVVGDKRGSALEKIGYNS